MKNKRTTAGSTQKVVAVSKRGHRKRKSSADQPEGVPGVAALPRSQPPLVAAAAPAESPDRLILRTQVAKIINLSVPTVRRLEKTVLKPMLVDDSGTRWHSLRAVHAYAAELREPAPAAAAEQNVDGKLAAQAFVLLDDGADAADLVKALEIPTKVARSLETDWAEIRGHMFIDAWTLSRLRGRRVTDDNLLLSAEDLLRYMDAIEFPVCQACRRPPSYCTVCFHHRPPRAVESAALSIQQAEDRREEAYRRQLERDICTQARERQHYAVSAPKSATGGGRAARPNIPPPRRPPVSDQRSAGTPPANVPVTTSKEAESRSLGTRVGPSSINADYRPEPSQAIPAAPDDNVDSLQALNVNGPVHRVQPQARASGVEAVGATTASGSPAHPHKTPGRVDGMK